LYSIYAVLLLVYVLMLLTGKIVSETPRVL